MVFGRVYGFGLGVGWFIENNDLLRVSWMAGPCTEYRGWSLMFGGMVIPWEYKEPRYYRRDVRCAKLNRLQQCEEYSNKVI